MGVGGGEVEVVYNYVYAGRAFCMESCNGTAI